MMNLRKTLFVSAPLLLASTLGLVFWRVHHPPMSEQDVQLQRFINSHSARVYLYQTQQPIPPSGVIQHATIDRICVGSLTSSEMSSVANQSYVSNSPDTNFSLDGRYTVEVELERRTAKSQHFVRIRLGLKERAGEVVTDGQEKMKRAQMLYPLSTQAWTRFLFFHPRIGPAVRHRLGVK